MPTVRQAHSLQVQRAPSVHLWAESNQTKRKGGGLAWPSLGTVNTGLRNNRINHRSCGRGRLRVCIFKYGCSALRPSQRRAGCRKTRSLRTVPRTHAPVGLQRSAGSDNKESVLCEADSSFVRGVITTLPQRLRSGGQSRPLFRLLPSLSRVAPPRHRVISLHKRRNPPTAIRHPTLCATLRARTAI